MKETSVNGKIIFINHDKGYATIEYLAGNRKKTINANISKKEQLKLVTENVIKKYHHYKMGDEVSFVINLSARGDKMIAEKITFRFNDGLSNLTNKAATIENRFVGYLKKVEENYFVKETGSYILFPLVLSPWEQKPQESNLNEPFFFKLDHADNPNKATASSFKPRYIPEYLTAQRYCESKRVIDATVYKTTAHSIFVHIISEKISSKIPIKSIEEVALIKAGDLIKVVITYVGPTKIIVAKYAGDQLSS